MFIYVCMYISELLNNKITNPLTSYNERLLKSDTTKVNSLKYEYLRLFERICIQMMPSPGLQQSEATGEL